MLAVIGAIFFVIAAVLAAVGHFGHWALVLVLVAGALYGFHLWAMSAWAWAYPRRARP